MKVRQSLIKWCLNGASHEERSIVLSTALKEIGAVPHHDIIAVDIDGVVNVNGTPVDYETAKILRESAKVIKDSPAWRIVRDQVAFKAVNVGVHNGNTPEQVMFSKTALWNLQELEAILTSLASE